MGRSSSLLLLSASLSLRRRRVGKGAVTALTPHHLHKCSAVPTRSGPNANDTRPRRHGAALCVGKDAYVVRAFAHPTTPPSPKKRGPPSCITWASPAIMHHAALLRQRIRPHLELHELRPLALADAFVVERRAVAGGGPDAAALPAGVRIVDAAIEGLRIEAHRIRHHHVDHLAVLQRNQ